ncbi:hypothetical protein E4U37_006382, partial [Claviceps purpurea]
MAPTTRITSKSAEGSEFGSAPGAGGPSQAATCVPNSPPTVSPSAHLDPPAGRAHGAA